MSRHENQRYAAVLRYLADHGTPEARQVLLGALEVCERGLLDPPVAPLPELLRLLKMLLDPDIVTPFVSAWEFDEHVDADRFHADLRAAFDAAFDPSQTSSPKQHARSCRCDECQSIARSEHDYAGQS